VESAPGDELEPEPPARYEDEAEEIGRPEGGVEERNLDPFAWDEPVRPATRPDTDESEEGWADSSPHERDDQSHDADLGDEDEAPARAGHEARESDEDEADEARPGSLFSHERETPAARPAPPQAPVFGRRGKRRGR